MRRIDWSGRVRACLVIGALAIVTHAAPAFAQPSATAGTPPAASGGADTAQATLSRARELFESSHYREAIEALDAYIIAHPRDARAYVMRGDSKASIDQDDEALRDYNVALKIDPEYEYGYVTRCQTRLERGDSSGALDDCNAAIRLDGDDPQAYEYRGDVHFDRDQYTEAITDFGLAIEHGSKRAYPFAARCDSERYVGKMDRAAVDCDRALTIDPKSARGLWARGRLELTQNNAVAGLADFNSYVALNKKGSGNALFFRGAAYNRVQKWSLALEDLNLFLKAYPKDGDGYTERGIAQAELHDTAAAEKDFASALTWYRHSADESGVARVIALIAALHTNAPLAMPPL